MTKYCTVKNTIQATEVRSEHIITCRGSLEWKQSLQVAKKQCNWHQIGKVLLVRLSLLSLICNCSAKALEELAALWQTSVSSVFDTLAPESVSLAVQIFKMQTFHISLTASRHIEPSISTSHLIRHHLKVLSYSVCGKVLPKKMAQEKWICLDDWRVHPL